MVFGRLFFLLIQIRYATPKSHAVCVGECGCLSDPKTRESMTKDQTRKPYCYRCGVEMEEGFTNANGLLFANSWKPQLVFVIRREPTSINPVRAFIQGLRKAPENEAFWLRGRRCPVCGVVELIATDQTHWLP